MRRSEIGEYPKKLNLPYNGINPLNYYERRIFKKLPIKFSSKWVNRYKMEGKRMKNENPSSFNWTRTEIPILPRMAIKMVHHIYTESEVLYVKVTHTQSIASASNETWIEEL